MNQESIPRDELARQLGRLRERDGLADEGRLERYAPLLLEAARHLLALEGETQEALTPRAMRLVHDAARGLAPQSQQIVAAAFNFTREAGSSLERRLGALARELHYSDPRHLADRERSLHLPLADHVLQELRVAQNYATHRALARGDGDATAAALLVVEQFRSYFRIYTPLGAISWDLTAWLGRRKRQPDRPPPDEYLDDIVYSRAMAEAALDAFIRDLGGIWMMADPNAETTVSRLLDQARRLVPFSEWDNALLTLALSRAPNENRVAFEGQLREHRLGGRYRRRLGNWLSHCDCNLNRPKKKCEPHQAIQAIETFCNTIDQEWYRLATWYHLPPASLPGDRNPPLEYFRGANPADFDLGQLDRG
ncbi:MAG: hypothetical protein ACJ74O_17780 [Frankiaceae bacterium]